MKKITLEEHFGLKESVASLPTDKYVPYQDMMKKGVLSNIEERLRDMDEAGINMQVLSMGGGIRSNGSASEGISLAKRANNELAEVISKYPDRFSGFAALALQDPAAAADELERGVKELGLKGTMISGEMQGEYLDDEKYYVLLERAEQLNVPIYIHLDQGGEQTRHMLRSGIFDRYPGLTIILGHMGETIPFQLWRINNQWQNDKVEMEKAGTPFTLKKKPAQYFLDNFYITTSGVFWEPALQFTISVVGVDRILFSVDYPPESNLKAVQFIESVSLGESDREKICHLNAEKLLKL